MCKCISAVRIFPCDCDVEGEGVETGEGDSWESTLIDRWELALELVHLRILPSMVSKAFKGVRERFIANLPLDFFSTLFLSFFSLKEVLQRLEGVVFWAVVCVKNWVGGGCFYRPKGGGRSAWWWGRSVAPVLQSGAPSSIHFLLASNARISALWVGKEGVGGWSDKIK
jgi:hypothetical protein